MTDKNLTDTEIKKALDEAELFLRNRVMDGMSLKLNEYDIGILRNISQVCAKAYDEINRLQADKEYYKKNRDKYQDTVMFLSKQSDELQAENERLKNAYKQCAWERDIFAEDMKEEIKKDCSYLMLDIKTIKAEAYKECIEKVKEEIYEALKSNYKARSERIDKHNIGETDEFISYCGGKIDCLRGLEDFLDNLLKELVGEDK